MSLNGSGCGGSATIQTVIDGVGEHLELLEVQAQRLEIAFRQAVAFPS